MGLTRTSPKHSQKAIITMASAPAPQDGSQADLASDSMTLDASDAPATPTALSEAKSTIPKGEKEKVIAMAHSATINDPFLQRKWLTD
jgi:hypothetical protein